MKRFEVDKIRRDARSMGMHIKGDFLIASRTADVVSGIAVDAAPSSIYLWIFVLPTYDDHSFLHMSLGHRVATCKGAGDCLSEAYGAYSQKLDGVASAKNLLAYIDSERIVSEYGMWVKYISYIRTGDALAASHMLEELLLPSVPRLIRQRVERVNSSVLAGGIVAAQSLLEEWCCRTRELLGN